MNIYALDYETYYDKTCSIRTLGALGYFSHPDFDCYMVSVVGDNGFKFVGHPDKFDWGMLADSVVLSHNASFDQTLYKYGVTKEWWPEVDYAAWHCTADLAAYCGLPRNLAGASESALGIAPDKSTRSAMMGKRWETMEQDFKKEVEDYALIDSELCLKLWEELHDSWPQQEQNISRMNREVMHNGIPIDLELLAEYQSTIKQRLFDAESCIPWIGEKPTLSRKAFNEQCRSLGITPPTSLAKTDVAAQEWIKKHGEKYKWIQAVSEWRRINSLMKKLQAIENATMPDGRYYGNIMYWGAHTGRFSGGGGNLNLQNLPRKEMFGVDLRKLIKAPEGKRLIVADLAQIEVRTLLWLAKDTRMLKNVAESDDIYETFAREMGLWTKDKNIPLKSDPDLRAKVKAVVLGAGFGAGSKAFSAAYGIPESEANTLLAVYKNSLPKVSALWRTIRSNINGCFFEGHTAEYAEELPLRSIRYGKMTKINSPSHGYSNIHAILMRNSRRTPVRMWHGLVTENLAQGLARDVFADIMLRLDEKGHKILFHVHDEVIIETDEEVAADHIEDVINVMRTPPAWIPDIPLDAEGSILTHYEK
jgi:DNA polymerase